MNNNWIPRVGDWVLAPKLFSPGELVLAQVTARTRSQDGNDIWLYADDRKFKLEHCQPPSQQHLAIEYQRLLELTATVGELLDSMQEVAA